MQVILPLEKSMPLISVKSLGYFQLIKVLSREIMMFQKTRNRIPGWPKVLFLVDGLGALLSAFLLGFVLVRLERVFGIPPDALYLLATVPCLFALYDFYCLRSINDAGRYLKFNSILLINFDPITSSKTREPKPPLKSRGDTQTDFRTLRQWRTAVGLRNLQPFNISLPPRMY